MTHPTQLSPLCMSYKQLLPTTPITLLLLLILQHLPSQGKEEEEKLALDTQSLFFPFENARVCVERDSVTKCFQQTTTCDQRAYPPNAQ